MSFIVRRSRKSEQRLDDYRIKFFQVKLPMGKGKDKFFQWNIEMKPSGSKSGKFKQIRPAHDSAGEHTNLDCQCRCFPQECATYVGTRNFSFL